MLTRLIARSDVVAEPGTEYNAGIEYEYEYREAEYEYGDRNKPEPSDATEPGLQGFTNGQSTVPAR